MLGTLMTTLVSIFLLLATLCAACGLAWLALRRRIRARAAPLEDAEARFARETLARLQELTSRVAADVDQHSSQVQEINAQLADPDGDNDESAVLSAVAQLIDANARMQRQLDTAEERLQAQARQIESHAVEARTDALTQVANRRALDDEIRRCVAEQQRRGSPAAIMLIDVDHFKKFNDTHGHQAGDEVLRGVARVLRANIGEGGLVARYGGEEFAAVFAGLGVRQIMAQAEKARQAIAGTLFKFAGKQLKVTASAGLAELMPDETEKDLVRRADEALYASKSAGRNCAHYSDGRSNHLVKLDAQTPIVTATPERIGDEWLYEADAAESCQREPLAHVSSRPVFFDDMIRRLSQWRRGGSPLALMLLQVDGFERIVGDNGTSAGDVVLRVTAQLVNAVMRDMDHVARLGDDTFAMLLPGAHIADAVLIGERLRGAVERCRLPRKAGANWFTISLGVVEACPGDDLRRILERARKALQTAVNQGRNRVCVQEGEAANVADLSRTTDLSRPATSR
ncbi:MAG: diguanylate cyclase [Pirellulaceae bacterium]|nr:diguanylate cyclase [Pirellulaceae bacterium]